MIHFLIIPLISLVPLASTCGQQSNCGQQSTRRHLIAKQNGSIILAYESFAEFLDTNQDWITYRSTMLDPYPEMRLVHKRMLEWGIIHADAFEQQVRAFKAEDFSPLIERYDIDQISRLYDAVIEKGNLILPPNNPKATNLCLFLPYGSCFVEPEEESNTIYISLRISPDQAELILAHEYSHILHIDRRPEEPVSAKRELVSEGIAVYLTGKLIDDIEPSRSVPFMSAESFEWCIANETLIRKAIHKDLDIGFEAFMKRYIADGKGFAEPPPGFVEKTAYFIGYKIVEACVKKGYPIDLICEMDADTVIRTSGYFDTPESI